MQIDRQTVEQIDRQTDRRITNWQRARTIQYGGHRQRDTLPCSLTRPPNKKGFLLDCTWWTLATEWASSYFVWLVGWLAGWIEFNKKCGCCFVIYIEILFRGHPTATATEKLTAPTTIFELYLRILLLNEAHLICRAQKKRRRNSKKKPPEFLSGNVNQLQNVKLVN